MSLNPKPQFLADEMANWLKTYRVERPHYYILAGKTAVPANDVLEWGEWIETADRRVARSEHSSGVVVSTVFLGLDYAVFDEAPELFETMVFGADDCDLIGRVATWDHAQACHAAAIHGLALTDGEWSHFNAGEGS